MQYRGFVSYAYRIPPAIVIGVTLISILPFLLTRIFGFSFSLMETDTRVAVTVNIVFNVVTSTLAILTVLLCYIDFLAREDVSSPILGISLLCASVIDVVAILYQSNLMDSVYIAHPYTDVSSFIGLFSRTFHASALLMGIVIFLSQSTRVNTERSLTSKQFVSYMSIILLLLTSLVVIILINNRHFAPILYPELLITRPFDLLPLIIYICTGVFLMPRFYKLYPSVFSVALFLCLIPASVLQLHLIFGSAYPNDTDHMVSLFLKAFTYFIPFAGIAFNYYAKAQNEKKVIMDLNREAEERTKAEQTLTSVFNTSANGIIGYSSVRDDSGKIIDFRVDLYNQAAKFTNPNHKTWEKALMSQLYPANYENGLFDRYVSVVNENKSIDTEFYSNTYNKWFRLAASKRGDGITVVFNDISNIKKYEVELEQKVNELNRSNQELEEFAYIASHDLQEPLRKIRTFSDRLTELNENPDSKTVDYLQRINNAARRMQKLIDDLLEFSRVSRSNNEVEQLDLNELWAGILNDLEMIIEQKQATVTANKLPVLKANRAKLHQLFYNLVNNSLKFSDPGRKPVINLQYVASTNINPVTKVEKQFHTFKLSDNGIGFNQIYHEKVFHLFQRLHGKSDYEGSGIGLSVCKKIVENMHGTISVESIEGAGTTFTIELPRAKNK